MLDTGLGVSHSNWKLGLGGEQGSEGPSGTNTDCRERRVRTAGKTADSRQSWRGPAKVCLGPRPGLPPHPSPPLPSPNLNELLLFQVPLLDAVVPGATEQDVSLDGQTFDTVIVRGLKVVGWADGAHHAVAQLEHLQRRRAEPREGSVWGRP